MKNTNSNLHRSSHPWAALATIAFITLALAGAAQAATRTWTQTAAGTQLWNTTANWQDGLNSTAAGDTVNFTADIAGSQNITMSSTRTVGTLNLGTSGNNYRFNFSNTGWTFKSNAGDTLGTATINIYNNSDAVDGHSMQGTVSMQVENFVINNNAVGGRVNFSRTFGDGDGDGTRSPTMTLNAVLGAQVLQFQIVSGDTTSRNQWGKLAVNQYATFRNSNPNAVSGTVDDRALGSALSSYLADAITLNGGTLQAGGISITTSVPIVVSRWARSAAPSRVHLAALGRWTRSSQDPVDSPCPLAAPPRSMRPTTTAAPPRSSRAR